jgi:hypothetical protein
VIFATVPADEQFLSHVTEQYVLHAKKLHVTATKMTGLNEIPPRSDLPNVE